MPCVSKLCALPAIDLQLEITSTRSKSRTPPYAHANGRGADALAAYPRQQSVSALLKDTESENDLRDWLSKNSLGKHFDVMLENEIGER